MMTELFLLLIAIMCPSVELPVAMNETSSSNNSNPSSTDSNPSSIETLFNIAQVIEIVVGIFDIMTMFSDDGASDSTGS